MFVYYFWVIKFTTVLFTAVNRVRQKQKMASKAKPAKQDAFCAYNGDSLSLRSRGRCHWLYSLLWICRIPRNIICNYWSFFRIYFSHVSVWVVFVYSFKRINFTTALLTIVVRNPRKQKLRLKAKRAIMNDL